MKVGIGIDCGSTACKGLLLFEDKLFAHTLPTGWSPKESAAQVLSKILEDAGLSRKDASVVSTGYGRVGIDFSDKSVTEITCHALGAGRLLPNVRTVIDIGGQDSKVISVKDGKVLSFHMNDKCAAGTGRFLEMTAVRMGTDIYGLDKLLEADQICAINSMCAVFADSEIISLLAAGESREAIAGGVIDSVASRSAALAARESVREDILLTGGFHALEGLRRALSRHLGCQVKTDPYSRYAGALGAALIAAQMC